MSHWLWWQEHKEAKRAHGLPSLVDLKDVLCVELERQFNWMTSTLLLHGVTLEKINQWNSISKQYFSGGSDWMFS
jgi:hypothetical protein